MRIAIDISQIVYEGTGVARFTEGLVDAILDYSKDHYWIFLSQTFRRNIDKKIQQRIYDKGFSYKNLLLPPKLGDIWWNQLRPVTIDSLLPEIDWYISSDWTEPPSKSKKATIIHDLIFKRYPETVDGYVRSVMERKIPLSINENKVLFADSKATKEDLIEYFNIDEKKVVVNYPGVTSLDDSSATEASVRNKYNIKKPFFITVGKQEPRKNIPTLIDAFTALQRDDIELLIIGQKGWGEQLKDQQNIRFLGYVPDAELAQLYKISNGMIFPSLYEGFGYPALEAMLAGTAVALSNTSSLQEIGKDSALFFNPEKTLEITESMEKLLDASTRKQIAAKGKDNAKAYTWERYFDTLIKTLEERS